MSSGLRSSLDTALVNKLVPCT